MRWVNLETIIHTSESERERERSYSNAHIQSLEKWFWRIYLQGSNGETDIENRLMDMGKGEERVRRMERVTWKFTFSSVQLLSHVWLFATPWIAAYHASLSITNSRSSLRLTSIESVMPSSHLILCCPLLLSPIPPSIRVFSNESALHMKWPK